MTHKVGIVAVIVLQGPLKLEINEINMLLMRCDLFVVEFNRLRSSEL